MDIKKYKIVLPSMVTGINILCGLFAIFFALEGKSNYSISCWLIIIAVIMDGIDGKVAQITQTSSEFGIQFDSLADVITFGVATTVVIHKSIFIHYANKNPLFYLVPIAFLLCGAIRLAKFNTTATTKRKAGFTGLPIPTGAGALVSIILFFQWLQNQNIIIPQNIKIRIIIFYSLLISFLMISQLEYDVPYHFFFGNLKKHILKSIIIFAICITLFIYPGIAFFCIALFYILNGIAKNLFKRESSAETDTEDKTAEVTN